MARWRHSSFQSPSTAGQRRSHSELRRPEVPMAVGSSAAGDEGDHDVGGVAVEVLSAAVVDRRGSGIGVAGGELHVAQGHAGVERGHDERGAEHVRVHDTESGVLADRADPTVSGAPIQALAVLAAQDRSFVPFTDNQIDHPRRAGTSGIVAGLLPLPRIRSVRWPRWTARSSMLVPHASTPATR